DGRATRGRRRPATARRRRSAPVPLGIRDGTSSVVTKEGFMKILCSRMAAVMLVAVSAIAHAETGGKAPSADAGKLPITTTSEEARAAYLKARDLFERLRATDAHALYAQAIAKDGDFASAYLGLAFSSGTTKEFFDALAHAVAASAKASPGEQLL